MGIKKKRNKAGLGAPEPGYSLPVPPPIGTGESGTGQDMTIEAILCQLSSMRDNSKSFIDGPDADEIWQKDVDACDAATDILTALQSEGIKYTEQVRDLIADYNALAAQYQALHRKYEEPAEAVRLGTAFICPDCHRQITGRYPYHCGNCGKKLGWR